MLCLQEEEMLAEKVQEAFQFCKINKLKVFKEKDSIQNTREKSAESLDFAENGNFIKASSNWEYFEDSCSEKIDALFRVRISYKILANQFRFSQMLFWISVDWQSKTVLSNNN